MTKPSSPLPNPSVSASRDASAQLRSHYRGLRKALSAHQQRDAAQRLAQHVSRSAAFHHAKTVAFYLAADGELSLAPLIEAALAAGKRCFLPVANPSDYSMRFVAYSGNTDELEPNRWGVLEPRSGNADELPAGAFDLVFVPLVACDETGSRLGMGKGFYDRAFADPARPVLLGVAHDCQLSPTPLPREPWDVPLSAVATPTRLIVPA